MIGSIVFGGLVGAGAYVHHTGTNSGTTEFSFSNVGQNFDAGHALGWVAGGAIVGGLSALTFGATAAWLTPTAGVALTATGTSFAATLTAGMTSGFVGNFSQSLLDQDRMYGTSNVSFSQALNDGLTGAALGGVFSTGGHLFQRGLQRWGAQSARRAIQTGAKSRLANVADGEAEAAYRWIRSLDADTNIQTVARNTGLPKSYIAKIREHVFFDKHLLPSIKNPSKLVSRRFDADVDIATWWKAATEGAIPVNQLEKVHRLFAHEYIERALIKTGLPYRYYDNIGDAIYTGTSAHELSPIVGNVGIDDIVDPLFDVWSHWR